MNKQCRLGNGRHAEGQRGKQPSATLIGQANSKRLEPRISAQFVSGASRQERDLLKRLLVAKDQVLFLTPGFKEAAAEFNAKLLPHNGDIALHPEDYSDEETAAATANHILNHEIATPLAQEWGLPWIVGGLDYDLTYLGKFPFSGAPIVGGTALAVSESLHDRLPIVTIDIDVRFPKQMILERIDRRLDEARAALQKRGDFAYEDPRRETKRLETMLHIRQLREDGMTQEAIAKKIDKAPRTVQRLEAELTRMLDNRSYREIAPYSHNAWAHDRTRGQLQGRTSSRIPIRIRPVV